VSTLTLQPETSALTTAGPELRSGGERIFFPGLNVVRAYAALAVLVYHMRQLMMLFHVPIDENFYNGLYRVFPRGEDGVMLFFVLSGFLITYLLLAEQGRTGTVHVAKFYVRRILRIWPLYYLLVLIGFWFLSQSVKSAKVPFLLRDDLFLPRLAFYLALMPNVAYALWPGGLPIGHLWSIGVEEQFYLVWPLLMKWCGRYVLWVCLGVIAIKAGLYYAEAKLVPAAHRTRTVAVQPHASARRAARAAATPPPPTPAPAAKSTTSGARRRAARNPAPAPVPAPSNQRAATLRSVFAIIRLLRLDCMAVGGLAAYVAFHLARRGKGRFARWLYHPITALLSLAPVVYIVATMWRPYTPYGGIGHAAIYALAILCAGANPNLPRWLLLALTPIDYLGRISYGIYMYHVPVMFCLLRYLAKHRITWHTGWTYLPSKHGVKIIAPKIASTDRNVALLLLVTAIVIAVATISFYAFERPFLRAKRRYTVIRSGSPEQA
jgi:peptidoglycan/LPS O-acetylase OafA/YrhL